MKNLTRTYELFCYGNVGDAHTIARGLTHDWAVAIMNRSDRECVSCGGDLYVYVEENATVAA